MKRLIAVTALTLAMGTSALWAQAPAADDPHHPPQSAAPGPAQPAPPPAPQAQPGPAPQGPQQPGQVQGGMMMNCPMMSGGPAGQGGAMNCPMMPGPAQSGSGGMMPGMMQGQTQGTGPSMMQRETQGMAPGMMQAPAQPGQVPGGTTGSEQPKWYPAE